MLTRIKRLRILALVPLIASAALVHLAAPAGADTVPETIGTGLATGFVHGNSPTTLACQTSSGYTFVGVAIQGVTLGHNDNPLVGSTGFHNQPSGAATSDPLNGTPLGCDPAATGGSIAVALTGPGGVVPGSGTVPLISCPGAQSTCAGGPGQSNVLADEGTVSGAHSGNFDCDGQANTVPNVPAASRITCDLHGSFVRFGGAVLVSLTGCVNVIATNGTECSASSGTEDVLMAAHVLPVPLQGDCATPFVVGSACSFLSGPYLITKHGSVTGNGGTVDTALDTLYCIPPGVHTPASPLYPAAPNCKG